jgi:uncharacterized protein with beta-barrel porin domain
VLAANLTALGLIPVLLAASCGALAQSVSPLVQFQDIIDSSATGPNSSASGQAILDTCRTGANGASEAANNNRFQSDCNLLVGSSVQDTSGVTAALNDLAADQISAQNSVSVRRNDANLSIVTQRLQLLRVTGGGSAFEEGELVAGNLLFDDMTGGGASADSADSRLSAFINGRYITGDEDENSVQDGYDFDGWGVLVGTDYRFTDNIVAGLALNYSDGNVDYDKSAGNLDTENWGAIAYGTFYVDEGLFVEGSLGYNSLDYDMTRNIVYSVAGSGANQRMTSSPEGELWSASFGGGYAFNSDSWTTTPALRFDYVENDVDGYKEKSTNINTTGGAMALAVDSATYKSFTSNLGLQFAKAISTNTGVIVPQVSAGWIHEFEDGGESIKARYLNDINQTGFLVATTDLDSDYFDLSVGVSGQFRGGRSGFIAYRTLLGYDGLTYNVIEAGFRFEL